MTKEERNQNADALLEIAEKIGQIDDLDIKSVARAFLIGYAEGRAIGIKVEQNKQQMTA